MSDVYKIGVQLAMSGNMLEGLGAISRLLTTIDSQTEGLIKKWDTLGKNMKLALGGAVATGAGIGIFETMKSLIEHGNELVHAQQQFLLSGGSQAEMNRATSVSFGMADKYGLNVSKVLGDIKEARMVFGSTDHAIDFIEPLEKMRVTLNAAIEGRGNEAADAVYKLARSGELKGLLSPEDFVKFFDTATKAMTASGGKVSPDAYLQAIQYGRLSTKGWNAEFTGQYLPSLIQELGGSQTGTALMSLFGTLAQGKVSIRSLNMMDDLGLIADPDKVIKNKQGNPKGFQPGAIVGTEEFIQNPYKWSQDFLRPLVEKKLGHPIKPGDEDAIALLGGMFGNRTSAQAIATMLLESQRIEKDAALTRGAGGLNSAGSLLANDPNTAAANFSNSWNNLLQALGSPLVPAAVSAMNSIASVFKSITAVAAANPKLVEGLGKDALIAGGALTATGVGAMGLALFNTLTGKGGLMGSAAALNTSAVMLQQAAVALGAKGVAGGPAAGPGGITGGWFGTGMKLLATYAVTQWLSDVMGNTMSLLPHKTKDYYGKDYDPEANLNKGIWQRLKDMVPRNEDGSVKWWDRGALNQGYRNMGGTASSYQPPPVNVAPPQVQTQVNVSIDGKSLAAIVTQQVKSAMGSYFPTGAPTPNTGTMAPAIDGTTGH